MKLQKHLLEEIFQQTHSATENNPIGSLRLSHTYSDEIIATHLDHLIEEGTLNGMVLESSPLTFVVYGCRIPPAQVHSNNATLRPETPRPEGWTLGNRLTLLGLVIALIGIVVALPLFTNWLKP